MIKHDAASHGMRAGAGRGGWWRGAALVLSLLALPAVGLAGPQTAGKSAEAAATRTVTDMAGRTVKLPAQVDRVMLGEGRLLSAYAVVESGDPSRRLVAMMGDLEQLDPATYAVWRKAFPRLDQVPRIGRAQAASFSDERALAGRPQVALLSVGGGHGPSEHDREVLARLEAAGVAVVFVDFRHAPLKHTVPSIRLLGEVLGEQARAAEFARAWEEEMAKVRDVLVRRKPQPTPFFMENRVGFSEACCDTLTGMLADLAEAAGGQNLAQGVVPGEHGQVSPEWLLTQKPAVYIGTAIGQPGQPPGPRLVMGASVDAAVAQASLRQSLQRTPIRLLPPVRTGRAHALWHHFYASPFNVLALQAMAQWLHPSLFADLRPAQTLQAWQRRFQPVQASGTYWVSAS